MFEEYYLQVKFNELNLILLKLDISMNNIRHYESSLNGSLIQVIFTIILQ